MERMKNRINRGVLFVPIVIGGIAIFTWIVMLLWNDVLTAATGVRTITYFQALGIFVLSKILFGFNRGWGGRKHGWRQRMMEAKFAKMTPEEREAFKAKWKDRCGGWRSGEESGAGNEK